jgi:hypothetical protein
MKTIEGVIRNGEIKPSVPLDFEGQWRCLITIFDEDLEELRRRSQAMLPDDKQDRLSELLQLNKSSTLSNEQEKELNGLLAEVYELAAERARAGRILDLLHSS